MTRFCKGHQAEIAAIRALLNVEYSVAEASDLVGVSPRTLTDWTDLGLPHRHDEVSRKIWINGREFGRWFDQVRMSNQKYNPMKPGDIYCLKCRRSVTPLESHIIQEPGTPTRRTGLCPHCGRPVNVGISLNADGSSSPSKVKRPIMIESPTANTPVLRSNLELMWRFQKESPRHQRFTSAANTVLRWASLRSFFDAPKFGPTLPEYLQDGARLVGSGPISREAGRKICQFAREFFEWLVESHRQKTKSITRTWLKSLVLTRSANRSIVRHVDSNDPGAIKRDEQPVVSEEEILKLTDLEIPEDNLIMRRDRAAASFLFCSGMRGGAFVSMPVCAVDLPNLAVFQSPEIGVETKLGKRGRTFLWDIPLLLRSLSDWQQFLLALPDFDPQKTLWFLPLDNNWGKHVPSTRETTSEFREGVLNKSMKRLWKRLEMPHKSPHAFRRGFASYGLLRAADIADYKAISANLLHSDMSVTDRYYAKLANDEQKRRLLAMSNRPAASPAIERYGEWGQVDPGIARLLARIPPDSLLAFRELLARLAGAE